MKPTDVEQRTGKEMLRQATDQTWTVMDSTWLTENIEKLTDRHNTVTWDWLEHFEIKILLA